MRHVRPDKWADAARGRLSERQLARMESHLGTCSRCAAERERVERSLAAYADIRAQEPDELSWEHIGARIYWVTSSERRTGRQAPSLWRRRWLVPTVAAAAVAAIVLIGAVSLSSWFGSSTDNERMASGESLASGAANGADSSAERAAREQAPEQPMPAAAVPLAGIVTYLEGDVSHNGAPLRFDALIAPGDSLQTNAGRVAVQFGAGESFTLHGESQATLAAFDERAVQLDLRGHIAVEVSHRQPGQRFAVHAGDKQIEVRGTRFSVDQRPGQLRVSCSEGAVAVLGGVDELSVPAGSVANWLGNAPSLRDMAPAEVEDLGRWLFRVPTWTAAPEMRDTTSNLRIAASAKDSVEIDGQLLASGNFTMRVMPGRHHVRSGSKTGSWVEVAAGATADTTAVAADSAPVAAVESPVRRRANARSKRRKQLNRALAGGARLNGCVRALRKQNLLDSAYIELELGVSGDGTIGYLNIVDSNLSSETASCIRDAVDRIKFGKGPAASWQHRIEW